MFDHLLKQSIVESEAITHAVVHIGRAMTTDSAMTAYLDIARRVTADPAHVLRHLFPMGQGKSSPWW